MIIHNEPNIFKEQTIKRIEVYYDAKYVFESCIETKDGGWTDRAFAIFYTEEPHPKGSNYFAIGWSFDGLKRLTKPNLIITDGISATKDFQGVLYNGEVYYSRFCHDFRQYPNGLFVDGGRDYTRFGGPKLDNMKIVKIKVNKDRLEIVNEKASDYSFSFSDDCYISGYSV